MFGFVNEMQKLDAESVKRSFETVAKRSENAVRAMAEGCRQKPGVEVDRFRRAGTHTSIHFLGAAPVLDVDLVEELFELRKMRSRELADRVGITEQNISLLKSGKVKGIRFETLARICEALECQPGDWLEAVEIGSGPNAVHT